MIVLPDECLRGLDCQPYAQIQSNCGGSFICCGLNSPEQRAEPQDKFRVCWKNEVIDEMTDWDRRDLTDTISVMAQALSVDANIEAPAPTPQEQHCGGTIRHDEKYEMVEAGQWQATAEPANPARVSFHIWSAYSFSPNATWGQLASEWEDARGNPDLLKTFVNTVLGECWEDEYSARLQAAQPVKPQPLVHAALAKAEGV